MDEIGRSYLTLALHLDRHLEGFVDAYFGPPEIKAEVHAGPPRFLSVLADDARRLQDEVEASDYDPQRKDFLTRQVRAMAAVVQNLSGDRLEFVQEVELYFDIRPEMMDEATFDEAHRQIDRLLPGKGSLLERTKKWNEALELEDDRVLPVFDLARQETRRRTLALFDLPPGEDLQLKLVQDQPWGAYNWYLGEYQSLVEINTDLPLQADAAVPLLAHEAYAGHHTEHALKEHRLYRNGGRGEHAVQLLLAPECVLSEGIADSARQIIFGDDELAAFLGGELLPLAGLSHVDAEQLMALGRARRDLRWVGSNAALLLHRENRPVAEVQEYVEHYALRTPREAVQTLRFIQNPLFRAYVFNYASGRALLAPLLEGPEATANFARLLSEPFTPTQVHRWLASSQ